MRRVVEIRMLVFSLGAWILLDCLSAALHVMTAASARAAFTTDLDMAAFIVALWLLASSSIEIKLPRGDNGDAKRS